MRRSILPIVAGVMTAMLFASGASAATLSSVQGDVLVNQGAGFKPVKGGSELRVGDSVMAQAGAQAQLSYADGCKFPVQVGVVVHVGAQSPCATLANAPKPYGSGVYDPRNASEAPRTTGSIGAVDPGFGALAGGALVVGGIVAVGVGLSRDRNRASSP